jgi:hypothetical protein
MWHLQSTEEFKRKFPEVAAKPEEAPESSSWNFRFTGGNNAK